VPIVAVATGIFPREQLAELGPDLCVDCCTELLTQ
jgi:phosphoglycolate phosphatase-like HAD superfamily hydrolase